MKKSVLVISSEFPPGPGGIGQHAYYLAKFLYKYRDVFVLTNGDYASLHAISDFDRIQPFETKRFRRFGLLTPVLRVVKLIQFQQRLKPNVVVFTGLFSLWLLLVSRLITPSAKRIAIIHGHEPIFGTAISRAFTRYVLGHANHIAAVSRFAANNVSTHWRQDVRVCVIPNGIDLAELAQWEVSLGEKDDPETSAFFSAGFPVLLTIGHTSRRKGQHNVIHALPLIKKSFPDVIYYCVGRDVHNVDLHRQAEGLGVLEHVVFVPPCKERTDLGFWYTKADIFMLLSENQPNGDVEGFGIVALEANYFGVPVIGSKGCGVEDAVQHGLSGLLVRPDHPEEIALAVSEILLHSSKYVSGAKAHAMEFDWETIGQKYLEILS